MLTLQPLDELFPLAPRLFALGGIGHHHPDAVCVDAKGEDLEVPLEGRRIVAETRRHAGRGDSVQCLDPHRVDGREELLGPLAEHLFALAAQQRNEGGVGFEVAKVDRPLLVPNHLGEAEGLLHALEEPAIALFAVEVASLAFVESLLDLHGLRAGHGDGDVVGDGVHDREGVVGEMVAGAGAEGKRAQESALREQGVADEGLDTERAQRVGAGVGRRADLLGHDADAVAGGAATDRGPVVEPLDASRFIVGNAGAGVQVQAVGLVVDHEVQKDLAVEVRHDLAAECLDQPLRTVAGQQRAGYVGEQIAASLAFVQVGEIAVALGLFAFALADVTQVDADTG